MCALLKTMRQQPTHQPVALQSRARCLPALRSRVAAAVRVLCAGLCAAMVMTTSPAANAWVDPTTGLSHPTRVTRRAEIPEQNWRPGHRGVDLALRRGDDVRAAGDGEVAFVGVVAGTPVVSIAHSNGLRTTYQPVDARVTLGEQVSEGQTIGTLARTTSQFAREHSGLHWGALTGPDAYIDPLTLLDAPRIRLKPLGDEPHR